LSGIEQAANPATVVQQTDWREAIKIIFELGVSMLYIALNKHSLAGVRELVMETYFKHSLVLRHPGRKL
jgi:hypothetical protein